MKILDYFDDVGAAGTSKFDEHMEALNVFIGLSFFAFPIISVAGQSWGHAFIVAVCILAVASCVVEPDPPRRGQYR